MKKIYLQPQAKEHFAILEEQLLTMSDVTVDKDPEHGTDPGNFGTKETVDWDIWE